MTANNRVQKAIKQAKHKIAKRSGLNDRAKNLFVDEYGSLTESLITLVFITGPIMNATSWLLAT